MSHHIFDQSPHVKLLQQLANGPLEQTQNLSRAVRQWAILRSIYSEEGYNTLSDFTYAEWCKAFFSSTHPPGENREEILRHQDPNCACTKTTAYWLSKFGMPVQEWRSSLERQTSISMEDVDKFLQERLFAQVRKSFQYHFDQLLILGWIKLLPNESKKNKKNYCRVESLPIFDKSKKNDLFNDFTAIELADLAQALDMLSFLDPKLAPLAEKISEEVYGTRRVFLHIDYVVPTENQDEVDDLQEKIQEIWRAGESTPVLFDYDSAKLKQLRECIVYPVCIYYVQRAKYLCAYGFNPEGEINWYNYRLDRIRPKSFSSLAWADSRVPQLLLEKHQRNQLPKSAEIENAMKGAWGFDFYKESCLMLLRFDRNFHQRYIQGTFRHHSFKKVEYSEAIALMQQQNLDSKQYLLRKLQSLSPEDAYYQAFYRVDDNNVIMRLRAWGPNVEVLLPWTLREQMALDTENTWNLYK